MTQNKLFGARLFRAQNQYILGGTTNMFYNRFARQFPIDTKRTLVRPSLGHHTMWNYGLSNQYGWTREHEGRELNRGYNHEINRGYNHEFVREWNGVSSCHMTAPADILELDEQFIIEVALPGVVLDDVQLKIEENVLSITAKRTPTLFEERAVVLQKELPSVYLLRQFEFDTEIVAEQIDARLDRGILYISVPKVEAALRVPVSSGMIESHVPNAPKTRVSSKHEVTVK